MGINIESHLPMLSKWLELEPSKKCLNRDITCNLNLISKRNTSLIKKSVLSQKAVSSFIIYIKQNSVAYIQISKASDLLENTQLLSIQGNIGTIDVFIAEPNYCQQMIDALIIKKFLEEYGFPNYRYILVTPELNNEQAIEVFEKSGFIIWRRFDARFWMLAHKKVVRLSISDMIALELNFYQTIDYGFLVPELI